MGNLAPLELSVERILMAAADILYVPECRKEWRALLPVIEKAHRTDTTLRQHIFDIRDAVWMHQHNPYAGSKVAIDSLMVNLLMRFKKENSNA